MQGSEVLHPEMTGQAQLQLHASRSQNAVSDSQITALTRYKIICLFAPEGHGVMPAVRFRLNQAERLKASHISICRKGGRRRTGRDVTGRMLTLAGVSPPEVVLGGHGDFPDFLIAPLTQGKKPSVTK